MAVSCGISLPEIFFFKHHKSRKGCPQKEKKEKEEEKPKKEYSVFPGRKKTFKNKSLIGKEKRVSNTVQEEVRKEVRRLKDLKDMLVSFCTQITQKRILILRNSSQVPFSDLPCVLQASQAAAAVAVQVKSLTKGGA